MTIDLKKIYVVMTCLLMAVTVPLSADDYSRMSYEDGYCCEAPCCEESYNQFNLRAELLYWRPELCGLESAFGTTAISTTTAGGVITTTVTERDEEPHSKWNAGFRLGADAPIGCYDLDAAWTHFDGHANFRKETQHGHWKIEYDAIDLTFGRMIDTGSCFYVRPFIGLRGLKVHQTLDTQYETIFTSVIGDSSIFSTMDDKEDFWGIGPQIGLDADFLLGCNFSLYGKISFVTYYGRVRGRNFDVDTFTTTASVANGRSRRCFNCFGTDAELGIRWDKSWSCSCYCVDLMLKLGVEQHRIYEFSQLGSDGTLSLDGGTFGVGLGFRY